MSHVKGKPPMRPAISRASFISSLMLALTCGLLTSAFGQGNPANFITIREMLGIKFNFDAGTEMTNGSTVAASARALLNANKFEYWNKGSVTTSIILADHSLARAFDLGFDAHRSFRPLYHATFWPGINKVRVRFIGEVARRPSAMLICPPRFRCIFVRASAARLRS